MFKSIAQFFPKITTSASQAAKNKLIARSREVRLSIVTQFYPPDFAATGQFVDELAQQLSQDGMDVQVFTGQPSYAFDQETAPELENMGKVQVRRSNFLRSGSRKWAGRTISSLAFCGHALLHLLNREHRGDILLFTSEPPFLQIIGLILHFLFKIPYATLVYDLYPEVAVELNVLSENHGIVKFWDMVNRRVWQQAVSIIVPCETMRDRIVAKVPEVADKITVIHNWADPTWIKPLPKPQNEFAKGHQLTDKFTVLYSGNMGRCHDMDTILGAAWELQQEPVQFVFIGGGPKRAECQQKIQEMGLENCLFLAYQDKALLPQSLTACDLSLVSVDVGMEGLVAPSKFYSALSAGRPVAVICEKHSYLRTLVASANCGAAISNGDSKGLAGFIRYLAKDQDMAQRLGQSGHRHIQEYYTPQLIAQHYFRILRQAVIQNADLYEAMEREEFQLYYQPIVSLGTSKILGFEALVHWQHPLRGSLAPSEFLTAAAEIEIIIPLGWWILQQACRQLRLWQEKTGTTNLRIHIPLTSQQFFHADLIPQIDQVLADNQLASSNLVIEIEDQAIMTDAAATTAILLQLQSRNIRVCINNFGASYLTLDYLHRFPVGALKVDQSLVNRVGIDAEVVKFIETIVILARDLGMEAIAQGVNSQAQLLRMREIGLGYGQGSLFTEPAPAEMAETFLEQQQHSKFLHVMETLSALSQNPTVQDSSASDPPLVLVVDDDRSMRALLKGVIAKEGYRVVEATNGQQAIELFQQMSPDLVLLDAMMPEMDGFTCCRSLRQLLVAQPAQFESVDLSVAVTAQQPLPILMITALEDAESVNKAFAAGATDYVTKPINWAVLRQRLHKFLDSSH